MRRLIDADNTELAAVLEVLLLNDTDITIREVARRHSALKNPSAFTRNPTRMAVIDRARQRQSDARNVRTESLASRAASVAGLPLSHNQELARLRAQVQALVTSHIGCIRAVSLAGGMQALERFWAEYKTVADAVHALCAVPDIGTVIPLPPCA